MEHRRVVIGAVVPAFALAPGGVCATAIRAQQAGALVDTSLASRSRVSARGVRRARGARTMRMQQAAGDAQGQAAAPVHVKRVLVPIANGSEEIETACITDTLVRAGADVTVASVELIRVCTMSRGLKIDADAMIDDVKDMHFDLIAMPGGMPGAERLRDCATLKEMLLQQDSMNKRIAAICAAPAVILAPHGILKDRRATCFPAKHFLDALPIPIDTDEDSVVIAGNITTSKGPGTALVFALSLVEQMFGSAKALELAGTMLLDPAESW
ncbi:Protein DJ-1-like B [Porphyridium purpureum]|uniref:Protein DJ-1-like B n=1 Tax=Porphyridium purpureum TaxID=35688 RepID=A0A5J4Z7I2_PORPP|nr:Protein DJ-1-like B [Porphyridium purpureum]|eukprot:POR2633..scf295_1